jgi:AcrR family transcriptional regulator
MTARAEAAAATRERILDAALAQFLERWYDEVTVAGIAKAAGVSQQTIVNHFGTKEGLLDAAVEHFVPERFRDECDDPVEGVVGDYEGGGDATIRFLALEERVPAVRPFLAKGRRGHRAWVERAFADRLPPAGDRGREQAVALHVAATDVSTWKLLRRDMGMSRDATVSAMRALVDALHPNP